jgi:hypothetical protein
MRLIKMGSVLTILWRFPRGYSHSTNVLKIGNLGRPRRRVVWLTCASVWLACAPICPAANGVGAKYVGGTVKAIKDNAEGRISTTDDLFFEFRGNGLQLNVPYEKINLLEYGQNVNRRLLLAVAISPLFLLSKARQHFLTVGFEDSQGKQQALVFRVDKNKMRAVLVSLEARTGLKIEYQDDQARSAGR